MKFISEDKQFELNLTEKQYLRFDILSALVRFSIKDEYELDGEDLQLINYI